MSTQVTCPLCDHVSKHANHGLTFTDDDCDKVWMTDESDQISELMHKLGKEVFWCPCGDAVWMDGQWLISHTFFLQETGQ